MSNFLGKKAFFDNLTISADTVDGYSMDQGVLTTSSPTFAALTLSGLTASTIVYANASKAFTSLANGTGALFNNGSGTLSYAAAIKADGTQALTADWDVGAFDLTCVDMTATNFKLSGVGTLTSALGNVSLTTSLTAATGNEAALTLNYTTNKAAGNDTGLVINQTDTASPGTSYILDLQSGGNSKLSVSLAGTLLVNGSIYTNGGALRFGSSGTVNGTIAAGSHNATSGDFLTYNPSNGSDIINTSGARAIFSIKPTYNQASGDAANTDLLISRTSTATGSGGQLFIDCQDDAISRFKVYDDGSIYQMGASSQSTMIKQATVVVTTTAAATATATNLIPAGSMVVGVTCRNLLAVTGDAGFTGFSIGDGSDVDRWGANVTPSINETTDLTDITIASPVYYTAATSVVLTQVGGSTFVADGAVRVTVHYVTLGAPAL